jgi:hypothetical protein
MKVKTAAWRDFKVGALFDCKTTRPMITTEPGAYPYVTRSALHNGVSGCVSNDGYILNKGNCITIGAEGIAAFYQNKDFVSGVKVYTLRHAALNVWNAMFICTVLNVNAYKYNYGRARILEKIKRETIKLPADNNGQPDWAYMARYIQSLRHKPITTKITNKSRAPLGMEGWGEYTLDSLFKFVKGKRLTKGDMNEGTTRYIGAISENNGVRQTIDAPPLYPPNCITVNYNGSVGEAFYQPQPFWASDDVNVLYAKGWKLNKPIALFIITLIKANRYRFNYGRKWTLDKMKASVIKLPKLPNGTPDWPYMEGYIRSLPYSDKI